MISAFSNVPPVENDLANEVASSCQIRAIFQRGVAVAGFHLQPVGRSSSNKNVGKVCCYLCRGRENKPSNDCVSRLGSVVPGLWKWQNVVIIKRNECLKWCILSLSIPGLFFVIFIFSWQFTVNFQHTFCRCLELNRGPLELEATALPTDPRPAFKKFKYIRY